MKRLFISDLHLKDLNDPTTKAFFNFLQQKAPMADELYILGDFFEYWIGDDVISDLSSAVASALRNLKAKADTKLYFMHGNRDFLIGEDFCTAAGMTLISEPYKLPETDILLCHGDAECTSDTEYQKIRQMLRNSKWQQDFLSKSISERIAIAEQARAQSKEHQSGYPLTDLDDDAVSRLLKEHNARLLIHGHTHQPGLRDIANSDGQRLTLSDWDYRIFYAEIDHNAFPALLEFNR